MSMSGIPGPHSPILNRLRCSGTWLVRYWVGAVLDWCSFGLVQFWIGAVLDWCDLDDYAGPQNLPGFRTSLDKPRPCR